MSDRSRLLWQRLSVLILVGTLGVEAGIRMCFEALPSMAAKDLVPEPSTPCEPGPATPLPVPAWSKTFNPGSLASLDIVVSGDSMALGPGVQPEESFPWLLGEELAQQLDAQVTLTNLSINSGTGCDTVGRLLNYLRHQQVDLALTAFFADDLQPYKGASQHGTLYVDPQQVDGLPAQSLLTHSYAANWFWWKVIQPRSPATGATFNAEKTALQLGLNSLHKETNRQGIHSLSTLLAPTGAPLCSTMRPDSRPLHECAQLQFGSETLHELLTQNATHFVDLSELWNGSAVAFLPEEHAAMNETQRLPIHPNAYGHKSIATALFPALLSGVSTH
ncbi:MAG: hypothetical protein VX519_11575 [Myxococcota bacterium]|nr:hypothetical protein [Myxococcota bacterium]